MKVHLQKVLPSRAFARNARGTELSSCLASPQYIETVCKKCVSRDARLVERTRRDSSSPVRWTGTNEFMCFVQNLPKVSKRWRTLCISAYNHTMAVQPRKPWHCLSCTIFWQHFLSCQERIFLLLPGLVVLYFQTWRGHSRGKKIVLNSWPAWGT